MRRHARETIRRPTEFDMSFDWDLDEKKKPNKVSRKSTDYDLGDDDRYESDEDEES